jgi:ATP-dependent DNA ligase
MSIDFVNLMDGRSICLHSNEENMEEFWYSDKWLLEPTYQGRRIQCLIDENGNFKFWGKSKKYVKPNLDNKINHIIEQLKLQNLPINTLIDGYFSFGNNISILTQFFQYNDIQKTNDIQKLNGNINYFITDIIINNNKDLSFLPLFDRKKILNIMIKDLENVKLQKYFYNKKFEIFENNKDFEIFLFKDIESSYEFRISSKWKIFKEPECYYMIISGYIDGKNNSRHENMVVALEGSQYKDDKLIKIMNIPVNNTDDMIYFYDNKQEMLGKVFEIKAFEKLKDKYGEARFYKIRLDLKDNICIF